MPEVHTQGARTMGMQRIVTSAPEKRASGLLQAVLEAAAGPSGLAGAPASALSRRLVSREKKHSRCGGRLQNETRASPLALRPFSPLVLVLAGSLAGMMGGRASNAAALDPREHALNVAECHPTSEQPPNLWVSPGGGPALRTVVNDATWQQAAAALREALASSQGRWVVFFDSDAEICERPTSKVALCAADRIILPLSSSWTDYIRLLDDPANGAAPTRWPARPPARPPNRVARAFRSRSKNAPTPTHSAGCPLASVSMPALALLRCAAIIEPAILSASIELAAAGSLQATRSCSGVALTAACTSGLADSRSAVRHAGALRVCGPALRQDRPRLL